LVPFELAVNGKLLWDQEGNFGQLRQKADRTLISFLHIHDDEYAEAQTLYERWTFRSEGSSDRARVIARATPDETEVAICSVEPPRVSIELSNRGRYRLSSSFGRPWFLLDGDEAELVRMRPTWGLGRWRRASVRVSEKGKALRELPLLLPLTWFLYFYYLELDGE
jgi:hypothetical protein